MTNPILKAHLEGVEELKKQEPSLFWKDAVHCSCYPPNPEQGQTEVLPDRLLSFLTTYGINLLKAAKEAGPGEKTFDEANELAVEPDDYLHGYSSCRSSFHSAIDEGIRGIGEGR